MRILRIIPSMNPKNGGPCQGIRNSIPELKKLGIDNEVVCLDCPESEFLRNEEFIIHALGEPKGKWAYNAHLYVWLEKNLARYDTVILHGLWLYHSFATSKAVAKFRKNGNIIKFFIMPHGMLDPWFQKDKGRKIKAIRNYFYWRLIEKNVVNSADGLLFTCEQELLLARETFGGYHPKQELNISYGIQPPPHLDEEMNISFSSVSKDLKNRPYILFLSRIHPKKGVDLLIDAYQDLHHEKLMLPDLVIAGPLDSDYARLIFEKGKSSNNIHFPGMLTGKAKWGAYYGCEAFILPSHQENFGISVAEALACSKPVLISNQINIYKEIETGGGGIVDTDSYTGIKNLLMRWFALTENEKQLMSKKAKEVYMKNYEVEQTAQLLVHALEHH